MDFPVAREPVRPIRIMMGFYRECRKKGSRASGNLSWEGLHRDLVLRERERRFEAKSRA